MFRGERIKDLLVEKKVTKKKLAESVGVTAIGLDGIISGSNVRAGNLEKIADFFRLPIDYFFDREVEIQPIGQNEDESSLSDNFPATPTIMIFSSSSFPYLIIFRMESV